MPILFRSSGTLAAPGLFLRGDGGARSTRVPIVCAIVQRPDGLSLIDTGWSRAQSAWPGQDPGLVATALRGTRVRPEDAMASQLISLGLDPADVRHVFATHLFEDHVGGAVDFGNAVVHTTHDEWEARRRGGRFGYPSRTAGYASRLQLHTLNGPPALGFAASHDVFGDGTVLLLDARGHSRGGLAVAVKREDGGWVLHVGDAAIARDEWQRDDATTPFGRLAATDRDARVRVLAAIRTAVREHGAQVVASHDADGFAALPTTMEAAIRGAWDPRPAAKAHGQKARKTGEGAGSKRAAADDRERAKRGAGDGARATTAQGDGATAKSAQGEGAEAKTAQGDGAEAKTAHTKPAAPEASPARDPRTPDAPPES